MYISYEDFLSKGHKTTRGECTPPPIHRGRGLRDILFLMDTRKAFFPLFIASHYHIISIVKL